MQRIKSRTSDSSTAASNSNPPRRLSRVTPSEFDNFLNSSDTHIITEGRNEATLGRVRGESSEVESVGAYAELSARPSLQPNSNSGTAMPEMGVVDMPSVDDLKRRSVYRSVGTASSPDLASLVRKAKAKEAAAAAGGERGDTMDDAGYHGDKDELEVLYQPSPTPSDLRHPLPSLPSPPSNIRTTTSPSIAQTPQDGSSSSSVGTGSPRPGSTASTTADSPNLAVPSRTSPRKERLSDMTISSYVHVPFPAEGEEENIPTASTSRKIYASSNSSGLKLDSPRKVRPSSSKGEEDKGSFTSTMRKTSRFFRKLGVAATSKPSSHPSSSSAPTTPLESRFDTAQRALPPVPALPDGYTPIRTPPRNSSHGSYDHKDSVDFTIHSPNRTPQPAQGEGTSITKTHSKRRSMSVGLSSAGLSSAGLSTAGPSANGLSPTGGLGIVTPEPTRGSEEGDRLRSELRRWKLDLDGVLGTVGYGTSSLPLPSAANGPGRAMSAPTSPAPALIPIDTAPINQRPLSTPIGVLSDHLQTGLEHRRPTWDANWKKEHPSPPVPPRVRAGSLPRRPADREREDALEPPSIRLVSPVPSYSTDASDDVDIISLKGFVKDLLVGGDGVASGLHTITESSHSRESSNTTPQLRTDVFSSSPQSRTDVFKVTPGRSTGPPLLVTQSPSPIPSSAYDGALQASMSTPSSALHNRKLARQSVVAYPGSRAPALTQTRTESSSSLHSDAMTRGLSNRSLDGSSGGEDGAFKTDSPLGTPLIERAKEFAQKCWDEDPSFLEPRKIAEWLGSTGHLNVATLRLYIEYFDFANLRLDLAFRRLCEKLYLKAETQQVDRILEQFSRRYWETNPRSVYGGPDVVHAVAYSLLLLNTDLHVVDSTTRMSRQQFVRNTLFAIHSQTGEPETISPGLLFGVANDDQDSTNVFGSPEEQTISPRKSMEKTLNKGTARRSTSVQSWKLAKDGSVSSMPNLLESPPQSRITSPSDSSPVLGRESASISSYGGTRGSDAELETTLKDMYSAIKILPIFQPDRSSSSDLRASVSLSPGNSPYGSWNAVNRSGSRRSAASTMSGSSSAFKRSSVRGFGSFLGTSSVEIMRSSSPTPSTTTSFSEDNYSTHFGSSSQHHIPTIGFANSLSHTIIREQQEDDTKSVGGASLTDEELALLGPPWAKEGLIYRKHYWETVGKRAKEKNWLQVFVVISQGELKMFRFDSSGTRGPSAGGGGMGGGDWTSSAQSVGEVSLIHALCSAMPAPGYSRDRPHCFVLTLPSGGSYFFHAGTQDLVGEWVATCNYWSARLSKEPLSGGVSNMEYGWNRALGDDDELEEVASVRSGKSGKSGRSGYSKTSHHPSLAGSTTGYGNDRAFINDWKAPNVPIGASTLSEEAQLDNLRRHVSIIKAELAVHNQQRKPMLKLYSPRSANLNKASANWERKSQHLLTEIVKYQTYADNLAAAMRLRANRRDEKEMEQMLEAADDVDDESSGIRLVEDLVEDPATTPPHDEGTLGLFGLNKTEIERRSVDESVDVFYDPQTPTSETSFSERQ